MQFRDWGGMFMEHCHNTVHEDNAMLLRWEIDNGGAPFLRPLPTPIPTPKASPSATPPVGPRAPSCQVPPASGARIGASLAVPCVCSSVGFRGRARRRSAWGHCARSGTVNGARRSASAQCAGEFLRYGPGLGKPPTVRLAIGLVDIVGEGSLGRRATFRRRKSSTAPRSTPRCDRATFPFIPRDARFTWSCVRATWH